MLDETDIQKLLRLKRHEQPPAGYYEKFLQDFHRRQRADILRQPAWKIVLERIGAFFSDHSMGRLAYGSATIAVLLFAGVASYKMVENSGAPSSQSGSSLADDHNMGTGPVPVQPVADQTQLFPLRGPIAVQLPSPNLPQPDAEQMAIPRHVLDSRPVSYERSFSF